jgi:WD40 repeat protein
VLLDLKFPQAKLEATDVNALIADYDYLAEEVDLRITQSALRLSAHVLARDTRQLAGQLTGRLLGSSLPNIQAFLRRVAQTASPWLRPLRPSLTPPGGPLIWTLEDHTNWVTAVAITPEGSRAVSGSHDRTVRVWDLVNGYRLLTLEGHMGWVHTVAVTPDGHRAISGSGDRLLCVWDLEAGQLVDTLRGYTDWIAAVAVAPDGRSVISASGDHTLRVWDLENGQCARTLVVACI